MRRSSFVIRRCYSYRALNAWVDEVARGLIAVGLSPGDRVGIWSPNCAEWVAVQFATARAGIILVNINPAYRPPSSNSR